MKALNRLLDIGRGNFAGGLTTKKYAHLTKTSEATAKREIRNLVDKSLLVQMQGTRAVRATTRLGMSAQQGGWFYGGSMVQLLARSFSIW